MITQVKNKRTYNEKILTINEVLLTHTIELQTLLDKSHMSTGLQGEILRLLFVSRASRIGNGWGVSDVGKLSLE